MNKLTSIAIVLVVVISAGSAHCGDRLLSAQEFAKMFVTELRSRDPKAKVVEVDDLYLKVERSHAGTVSVFLDNAYRTYQLRPELLEEIVDQHASSALESMAASSGEVDVSRIVPVIKDAGYLDEIVSAAEARSGERTKRAFAFDQYNSDLIVLYAVDLGRSIRYLSEEELREFGLPRDAVRPKAIDNLRSILPAVDVHGGGGTYLITADGTYEASLLLFDELWRSKELVVNGELVVSIPARDVLLVTGSDDAEGLGAIVKMASGVAASAAYRLTEQLFVYRDGRFVRFER